MKAGYCSAAIKRTDCSVLLCVFWYCDKTAEHHPYEIWEKVRFAGRFDIENSRVGNDNRGVDRMVGALVVCQEDSAVGLEEAVDLQLKMT